MNVRIVVQREIVEDGALNEFQLDLEKAPNIVANYKWLDLSKPETRKSNFSQTIKIPFTNRNNQFFENWFDVNLDTLIYSSKKKYNAIVFVDSVPQLEGYIQLKSVYLNARLYEVVIFGDTGNFFSDIKGKKLRHAFETDGVIDRQLDHYNTATNVFNSWGTAWGSGGLTTVDGVTDNDVMYPVIDWGHSTYPPQEAMFVDPDALESAFNASGYSWSEFLDFIGAVKVGNLKPAIRIQRLLQIICQKAGYSIKSTFLGIAQNGTLSDTQWFSRLFMTLAPQYPSVRTKVYMGFKYTCGSQTGTTYPFYDDAPSWNTAIFDPNTMFQTGDSNVISIPYEDATPATFPEGGMLIQVTLDITLPSTDSGGGSVSSYDIRSEMQYSSPEYGLIPYNNIATNNIAPQSNFQYTYNATIYDGWSGGSEFIYALDISRSEGGTSATYTINSGTIETLNTGNSGYTNGNVNAEVVMAENMPDITQADFVKDLVNRFNLIVTADKEDPQLLHIEPYQDYIASGTTKYWTDKLDTSKELVVKSTNEIQSKELIFSDKSGKDYYNKSYEDKWGAVWGSRQVFNQNDFAQKDFKNFSIYSPFHAQGLFFQGEPIAVGYAYEIDEGTATKKPLEGASPMLFYYSGTPIDISGYDPFGNGWSFHIYSGTYTTLGSTEAYDTGNKFPLCTGYNLDNLTNGITTTTKLLYWNYYNPYFPTNFTFDVYGQTPSIHGYFNDYWAQYINEIYSDEARMMECYLHLDEEDIFNFSFANPVYIKNTLWRVLEISNHLIGGNKTTKVKLLKAITKLNFDCNVIPNTFNADGTITYINPATGATDTNVTNACCEDLDSSFVFQQTNNTTGVGICYHNTNITTAPTDLDNLQSIMFFGDNIGGGGIPTPNTPLPMPVIGSSTNTLINSAFGVSQETTLFLSTTTYGSDVSYFNVNGINNNDLIIPDNTMVQVNIKLMATNVTGYSSTNAGDVGHWDITTLLKRQNGTYANVGGTIVEKQVKDTNFPTPTISLINTSNNLWKPSVTVSGTDTIHWLGKTTLFVQPIPRDATLTARKAIYQNADNILMQDLNQLQWN
jgi:hypothetical protein